MSSKSLHVLFDDDDILLDAVKQIVKSKIYINEIYVKYDISESIFLRLSIILLIL